MFAHQPHCSNIFLSLRIPLCVKLIIWWCFSLSPPLIKILRCLDGRHSNRRLALRKKLTEAKGGKGSMAGGGYYDRYYRRNFDSSSFFKSGEKRKRKKQRSHFYDSRRTIEFLLFIPEKREKIVFLEIVSLLSS